MNIENMNNVAKADFNVANTNYNIANNNYNNANTDVNVVNTGLEFWRKYNTTVIAVSLSFSFLLVFFMLLLSSLSLLFVLLWEMFVDPVLNKHL